MSDEEYDEELPAIVVKSAARDVACGSGLAGARLLAAERARAAALEAALRELRAAAPPHHGHGSEGEVQLAAAVRALGVSESVGGVGGGGRPLATAFLPRALREHLHNTPPPTVDKLVLHVSESWERWYGSAEGVGIAAAVLIGGAVGGGGPGVGGGGSRGARGGRVRSAARHALRPLLRHPAFADAKGEAWQQLWRCVRDGVGSAPALALGLADGLAPAAAGGPPPGGSDPTGGTDPPGGTAPAEGTDAREGAAARLRRRLLSTALAALAGVDAPEEEQSTVSCQCEWTARTASTALAARGASGGGPPGVGGRRGAGEDTRLLLRVAPRLLRACPRQGAGAGCARSRWALVGGARGGGARASGARPDAHALEALVGASKLQLLLRD